MMMKGIFVAMAECMKQLNVANIIVLLSLSDVSCNLTTQLGSRKLVAKFILSGLI